MQLWGKGEDEKINFTRYSKVFFIYTLGLDTSTCHSPALSEEILVAVSYAKNVFLLTTLKWNFAKERSISDSLKSSKDNSLLIKLLKVEQSCGIIMWAIKPVESILATGCANSPILEQNGKYLGLRGSRPRSTSRDHTKALCSPDRAVLGREHLKLELTHRITTRIRVSVLGHRTRGKLCGVKSIGFGTDTWLTISI